MRFFVPRHAVISRGPTSDAVVSLTIDDGPDVLCAPILAALDDAKISATFFCIGAKLRAHPKAARAILAAGHELQNHTDSHGHALAFASAATNQADMQNAQRTISALGQPPRYFRAVAGMVSPPIHRAAQTLGLSIVHWSASARDGGPVPVSMATALARLEHGLVPGGILVIHDRAGQPAAALIPALAALARTKGLRFVTLSTLLDRSTHI